MSYNTPKRVTYSRAVTSAGGTLVWALAPPVGATQFKVIDMNVSATVTWAQTTLHAFLGVGVGLLTYAFAKVDFGTTAAGAKVGFSDQYNDTGLGTAMPTYKVGDLTGTVNTVSGTPIVPEVLGPVLITFTANTGGSAGSTLNGSANVDVTIDWF